MDVTVTYLSFVSYRLCRALALTLLPRKTSRSLFCHLRWLDLIARDHVVVAWHGCLVWHQRAIRVHVAIVDILVERCFRIPDAVGWEEEVHIALVRMQEFGIC